MRMNDDAIGNGINQTQPQLSASAADPMAPRGRIALSFMDERLPCPKLEWISPDKEGQIGHCLESFIVRNYADGDGDWSPNRRSGAQAWDPDINLPMTNGGAGPGFIGDYQGLASLPDRDIAFFNATADLGQNPTRNQQVFAAHLPSEPLEYSQLDIEPASASGGATITVSLEIHNAGALDFNRVSLTHTLPISVDFIADSIIDPSAAASYDPDSRTIRWTGSIDAQGKLELLYRAQVIDAVLEDERILFEASLARDDGRPLFIEDLLTISQPPQILSTIPPDGTEEVALGMVPIIRFSKPIDVDSFRVETMIAMPFAALAERDWNDAPIWQRQATEPGLEPHRIDDIDQDERWQYFWSPDRKTVSLRHDDPLLLGAWYDLHIHAWDDHGQALVAGPVPNPFGFTTEGMIQPTTVFLPHLSHTIAIRD